MTDEEAAAGARAFLAALHLFLRACEAYGVRTLDQCDPVYQLYIDAGYAVGYTQAELDGALRRMQQERISAARRQRLAGQGQQPA